MPLPLSSLLEPPVLCLISTELPLPLSDLEREMMELRKEEPAVMLQLPGLGACHGTGGGHQLTATCTQQYDLCRHATTITARKYFTLFVRRAVHISGLRHRITRRLESSYLYLSPGLARRGGTAPPTLSLHFILEPVAAEQRRPHREFVTRSQTFTINYDMHNSHCGQIKLIH